MTLIDTKHSWVVLVDMPDGNQRVALIPAETFDVESVLGLREQVGERAMISLISDESVVYCEATSDLKAQIETWLDIELDDPVTEDGADEVTE